MAVQTQKDRREQSLQRSLVVQGGEIGTVTHGHFQSYTNFSMEIVHAVSSPKGAKSLFGYVYSVKTSSGLQRECFVSTDDNQTVRTFVRAASQSHPHLQWAKIAEKLWSLYMLNLSKDYQNSPDCVQKTLVSCIGKQPNSNVWVLSPDIQIDHRGRIISKDDQQFYWHTEYIQSMTKTHVIPVTISTPLSVEPMIQLLKISKKCLGNNFISSFLTVAGAAVLLHYESILGMQDECLLMLCYSSKPGTGKSTSLRNALSLLGVEATHITGPDTHPATIVNWAAGTTIPLGIDDIRSAKKAESIAVQFFNGFSHNTCSSGELKPHTSVIITSNSTFCSSERNSQRILHVPFFSPTKPASPSDLRTQEMLLKQARVKASASIGVMIALGYRLLSPEVQEYLDRVVLPVVAEHLSTVHFRVQKCYALLLTSAQQLCQLLPTDLIHEEDVLTFFKDTWSPLVVQLHSAGGSIFYQFLRRLIGVLEPMKMYEVLQMVRPSVSRKEGPSIGLYMPMVREYCSLTSDEEKELKDAIRKVGGSVNQSGVFLATTSTATVVSKATGINRRSVTYIPRSKMTLDILEALDAACSDHCPDDQDDSTGSQHSTHRSNLSSTASDIGELAGSEHSTHNSALPPTVGAELSPHHSYLSSAISFIDELASDHFSLGGYETDPTICDNISELPSHQSCVIPGPSASALVNGVSTIKLVPYDSSDDDDEPMEPFEPQRASTPAASQGPLISIDSNSGAMFKPVRADTKDAKDVCPSAVCKMKRPNRRTWWVQCSEEKGCGQWYHQRCVGVTKKQAATKEYLCTKCSLQF